jgi:uncharacterized protein YjiS (DUF1127 family)
MQKAQLVSKAASAYLPLRRGEPAQSIHSSRNMTMSAIDTSRPAAPGLRGVLAHLLHSFASWNDARATRSALSKLTDRELDDIGLTRGDIDTVARNL